tara:strand:- start:926 stop:1126 length:201 start_codon:yes stop_codon:yes gene_type:complete
MKPSFIPLSSFAYEMLQSKGQDIPCLIHLPHMKPGTVEAYAVPPYELSEMFILCRYVAELMKEMIQ